MLCSAVSMIRAVDYVPERFQNTRKHFECKLFFAEKRATPGRSAAGRGWRVGLALIVVVAQASGADLAANGDGIVIGAERAGPHLRPHRDAIVIADQGAGANFAAHGYRIVVVAQRA